MASLNKVMLIGNLGKDPEIRYVNDNTPVATFSLATTESYTNRNGERVEQTEWHNIVAWRQLAEISEKYLHKGKQIFVEGKIRSRSYDDKDGIKRYITEIVADNITMLGRREDDGQGGEEGRSQYSGGERQGGNQTSQQQSSNSGSKPADVQMDDDLPF